MAENSAIEWTDHTWSPWEGCQKTGSPACENCYAEARNARFGGGEPPNWGPHAPRRLRAESGWGLPLRWDRDARERGVVERVFPSLCDPFDNKAPPGARRRFGNLILATPNLIWLLLTKRIGNAAEMLAEMFPDGTPANVWLGATVVTQAEADRDIPKLLATAAAKRFLSMEPLLGPVDLTRIFLGEGGFDAAAGSGWESVKNVRFNVNALLGAASIGWGGLDWIIVGGESGPGARPMRPDWARSLRDQCYAAGVPFLFKQWGEWAPVDQVDDEREDAVERAYFGCFVDGVWSGACSEEWARQHGPTIVKIGKKLAGRTLDGAKHNGFPA